MTAGRSLAIGLLALSLATGCGGDDGGGSSATEWADDVCSSITTWTDSISSTVESLRDEEDLTEDDLRNAVEDAESATNDFVDDLKGLGAPDADAGQQAKESLDQLADDVEENVATIEEALADASGGSGVLAAMTVVTGTLSTIGAQLSSTFAALEELDAAGELEEAFREADSCDDLESGSP